MWEILSSAYERIGFDACGNETFKQLVLARLVEPTSKADTIRVLNEIGIPAPGLRTMWRTLAKRVDHDWRDAACKTAYGHALKRAGGAGLGVVLYDVTTLYFEANDEDELRKVGMSKERRVNPQIVVGLLVDRSGFPLEIHGSEGHSPPGTTIRGPRYCGTSGTSRATSSPTSGPPGQPHPALTLDWTWKCRTPSNWLNEDNLLPALEDTSLEIETIDRALVRRFTQMLRFGQFHDGPAEPPEPDDQRPRRRRAQGHQPGAPAMDR